jgi:HAD superfamily hydrolase (TIGR01549 family)
MLGPQSFVVFPDVPDTLRRLRDAGIPVAIVSNWPCGLAYYCSELGLADQVDSILCSAELGVAKPDRRIFEEACRRLGTPRHRTLHVGDTVIDDVDGASEAGLKAILLRRESTDSIGSEGAIASLAAIPSMLGITG